MRCTIFVKRVRRIKRRAAQTVGNTYRPHCNLLKDRDHVGEYLSLAHGIGMNAIAVIVIGIPVAIVVRVNRMCRFNIPGQRPWNSANPVVVLLPDCLLVRVP